MALALVGLSLLGAAFDTQAQQDYTGAGAYTPSVMGPPTIGNPFGRSNVLPQFAPKMKRPGGWLIVPAMTAKEVYTDNVTLAPSGSEQNDFVTDLSPGISVHGNTRRLLLDLNYQAQNLLYADHPGFNTTNHLFQTHGTGTLIDHTLFVDFSSRYSPQNISDTGRVAIDNISVTGNTANVFTYDVSPYWKQRIGNFAKLETRFRYDALQSNQSNRLPTSRGRNWDVSLASGPRFTRLLWRADYRRQATTGGGVSKSVLSSFIADGKYVIDSTWAAELKAGIDVNNLGGGLTTRTPAWGVGGVWTPNARTYLETTIGRRYGKLDFFLNFQHRTAKTKWIANYRQEATTTRSYLLQQQVFPILDAFGNPIINVNTGQPVLLNVNVPVQTAEVILSKLFDTTFSYDAHRNHWQVSAFDNVRDYQVSGGSETYFGGNISWSHDLTRLMRSRLSLNWSQEDLLSGETNQYSMVDLTVTRRLSPTLEASLGARHLQKNSTTSGSGYSENRVTAFINKTF